MDKTKFLKISLMIFGTVMLSTIAKAQWGGGGFGGGGSYPCYCSNNSCYAGDVEGEGGAFPDEMCSITCKKLHWEGPSSIGTAAGLAPSCSAPISYCYCGSGSCYAGSVAASSATIDCPAMCTDLGFSANGSTTSTEANLRPSCSSIPLQYCNCSQNSGNSGSHCGSGSVPESCFSGQEATRDGTDAACMSYCTRYGPRNAAFGANYPYGWLSQNAPCSKRCSSLL